MLVYLVVQCLAVHGGGRALVINQTLSPGQHTWSWQLSTLPTNVIIKPGALLSTVNILNTFRFSPSVNISLSKVSSKQFP